MTAIVVSTGSITYNIVFCHDFVVEQYFHIRLCERVGMPDTREGQTTWPPLSQLPGKKCLDLILRLII